MSRKNKKFDEDGEIEGSRERSAAEQVIAAYLARPLTPADAPRLALQSPCWAPGLNRPANPDCTLEAGWFSSSAMSDRRLCPGSCSDGELTRGSATTVRFSAERRFRAGG